VSGPLIIAVRHEPGYVLLTAAGDIDIFTVARLREALLTVAASGQPVIADVDRVTFLVTGPLTETGGEYRLLVRLIEG